MNDIIIDSGLIITLDRNRRILRNGSVVIKDERIIAVDKSEKISEIYPAKKVIPGKVDKICRGGSKTLPNRPRRHGS